jgi:LysR family nod box-dependent transcriptional activator
MSPSDEHLHRGHLDLNLLAALDALLQERHVTHAADRISLSQPAMSRALGRLRRIFNDEILVRVGNELYPTPYASELVVPVHGLMEGIDELFNYKPHFDPHTDHRVFSVAATDYSIFLLLRPLAAILAEETPGISLDICQLHSDSFGLVQQGELDLVFGRQPLGCTLPKKYILEDRYMCAVWSGNEEVGSELTLEKFLELPHLAHQVGSGVHAASGTGLMEAAGIRQSNVVTIESFFILPFLLPSTRFVTLLPYHIGKRLCSAVSIRMLEPPFHIDPITLPMSWHPRSTEDPGHIWLRNQLERISANIA